MLLVLLTPSLRSSVAPVFRIETIRRVREAVRSLGAWGPVLVIALMILHSVTFVPAEVITISSVLIFGPVWGVVYAWLGAMIGASLSYFLAKIWGQPIVQRFLPKPLQGRFENFFEREGVGGVFILRLIPLISFNALNYALGVTPMTFRQFLWTTGLGILPMEIIIAVLYQSAFGEKDAVVGLTATGLVLLAGLVLRAKMRKKYRRLSGEKLDGDNIE